MRNLIVSGNRSPGLCNTNVWFKMKILFCKILGDGRLIHKSFIINKLQFYFLKVIFTSKAQDIEF